MKIEMGESLMQSWLKHAKECKITQLNWKPSTNWTTYNDQSIEELYRRMSTHFPVFKNNANYHLNSTHFYEPLLYKDLLLKNFEEKKDNPVIKKFIDKFRKCATVSKEFVPTDSLIREFIGD